MNINSFYRYARSPCCITLRLYSRLTCVEGRNAVQSRYSATQCAQRNVVRKCDKLKGALPLAVGHTPVCYSCNKKAGRAMPKDANERADLVSQRSRHNHNNRKITL